MTDEKTKSEEYYIQVLDQVFTSEEFQQIIAEVDITDLLPEYFKNPELGGITDPIGQLIHWLYDSLSEVINNIYSGLKTFIDTVKSTIINSITDVINTLSKNISSWISDLLITLSNGINSVINAISSSISSIVTSIQSFISNNVIPAISNVQSAITNTISGIVQNISSIIAGVQTAIINALSGLQQFIGNGIQAISQGIQSISQSLAQIVQNIIQSISQIISNATSSLQQFIGNLIQGIVQSLQGIAQTLSQIISTIQQSIQGVIQSISQIISNTVLPAIQGVATTISNIINTIVQNISSVIAGIQTALSNAISSIQQFIGQISTQIMAGIKGISDFLFKQLPASLGQIVTQLSTAFQSAFKTLQDYLVGTVEYIVQQFKGSFEGFIASFMESWKRVQDFFSEAYNKLVLGLKDVGLVLQGFVNSLGNIWGWIQTTFNEFIKNIAGFFSWIQEQFTAGWNAFVRWITEDVPAFFSWLQTEFWKSWDAFVKWATVDLPRTLDMIREDFGKMWKSVVDWFQGGIAWLQKQFQPSWDSFTKTFEQWAKPWQDFWKDPTGFLWKNVFTPLWNFITTVIPQAFQQLWGVINTTVIPAIQGFFNTITKPFQDLATSFTQGLMSGFTKLTEIASQVFKLGSPPADWTKIITGYIATIVPTIISGLGLFFLLSALGTEIQILGNKVKLSPELLGSYLLRVIDPMYFFLPVSLAISYSVLQPQLSAWIKYYARPYVPDIGDALTMFRRKIIDTEFANEILKYNGLPDELIEKYFEARPISFRDRFNVERKPNLALGWYTPTPHDIVTFLVKDLFTYDTFKNVCSVVGIDPDWADMYYFAHFRYPTMSQLFEAYRRTKAGMIWHIEEKPEELWVKALQSYAKWQDYFDKPWIEGFLTDRDIIIELMADIPTRIDARWMYKWGIITDEELRKIVIARKIHDKWIDPVTIAECMNALTEERTLYRTGLMNLYEEGLITFNELQRLMKGEAGVRFSLAGIDVSISPTSVSILGQDKVVKFLDGETKLLSNRAYIDRLIDIKKDYQRSIIDDYIYGVISEEEFKKEISQLIRDEEVRNIVIAVATRKKLRRELRRKKETKEKKEEKKEVEDIPKLAEKVVDHITDLYEAGLIPLEEAKKRIEPYVKLAEMTQEELNMIFADAEVRHERWYLSKKLSYAIRKLRKGKISIEEFTRFCRSLGIPDDLIQDIIDVEVKEHIPTVSKLATLSEYLDVPDGLIRKTIELEGIPEEEAKLWYSYIKIKPISSEARRLASEYISVYVEGGMTKDDLVKALTGLEGAGITPRERELLLSIAEMLKSKDLMRDQKRQVIDLYEDGMITVEEFQRAISELVKDEEIRKVIIALATRKRVSNKIKSVKRELVNAIRHTLDLYEAGLMSKEEASKKIEQIRGEAGITDDELKAMFVDSEVRRYRWYLSKKLSYAIKKLRKGKISIEKFTRFCRSLGIPQDLIQDIIDVEVREYVPSISKLATLSEYVWIPDEMINRVLELEGIPEEERKLWYLYIRNKPLSAEVSRLITEIISDYAEGVISKSEFEDMLRRLEEFGVTPEERNLLIALGELRKMRYEVRRKRRGS